MGVVSILFSTLTLSDNSVIAKARKELVIILDYASKYVVMDNSNNDVVFIESRVTIKEESEESRSGKRLSKRRRI